MQNWSSILTQIVMVPTLRTTMNSSSYYEYRENMHLGVKLLPANTLAVRLTFKHSLIIAVLLLFVKYIFVQSTSFILLVSFFRTPFTGPQNLENQNGLKICFQLVRRLMQYYLENDRSK